MNEINKKSHQKVIFLVVFMFLMLIPFAFAQSGTTGLQIEGVQDSVKELETELEETEEGTTPNSPLWGIDVALDRIKFNLARNKAETGLKIAQERLLEVKAMKERGNIKAAEKAAEKHAEVIAQVTSNIESIKEEDETKTIKETLELEAALETHLTELEDLKERLKTLTPEQQRRLLIFLATILENTDKIKIKLEDKEEKAIFKFEQKTGKSKLEIRDEINKFRQEKRIKARVFDESSLVTVDYRMKRKSQTNVPEIKSIAEELLKQVATTQEEASKLLKIERGDEESEEHDIAHELEEEKELRQVERQAAEVEPTQEIPSADEEALSFVNLNNTTTCAQNNFNNPAFCVGKPDNTKVPSCNCNTCVCFGGFPKCTVKPCLIEKGNFTEEDKIKICHIPSGNKDEAHTITVAKSAVKAHLEHGDFIGRCEDKDRIEDKEDNANKRLKVRIEIKQKEGITEVDVKFRLRFASGITREEIIKDIVEETNSLTVEEILKAARIKEKIKDKENSKERRIEIEIEEEDGEIFTEVKVLWDGKKEKFILKTTNKEDIIREIAFRLGVSIEEVQAAIKKFEVDDDDEEKNDKCNYDSDKYIYAGKTPEICMVITLPAICGEEGYEPFGNSCGCGCKLIGENSDDDSDDEDDNDEDEEDDDNNSGSNSGSGN